MIYQISWKTIMKVFFWYLILEMIAYFPAALLYQNGYKDLKKGSENWLKI